MPRKNGSYEKALRWLREASNHWAVIPALVFVSLADFFVIVIPAELFFVAALIGNRAKVIRYSTAMIAGRNIAIALVYAGIVQMPVGLVHDYARQWGLELAWNRCQIFFDMFGALSLAITALTPFPMLFVTAMSAVASVELWQLEVYATAGLAIRYGVLSSLIVAGHRMVTHGKST